MRFRGSAKHSHRVYRPFGAERGSSQTAAPTHDRFFNGEFLAILLGSAWYVSRICNGIRPHYVDAPTAGWTGQNHDPTQADREAATGDARRLLARSRRPPTCRYTPSAPRYGLRCVCCPKQMPNAVFQQFDGPLQGAQLSNPRYRYRQAQVK